MRALTLHGIWARRTRSALTLMAIVLGVTMVAGTFVYTDTINRSFGDIFRRAARGADAVVSGRGADLSRSDQAPTIPATLISRLQHVPGVARAEGQVSDSASLVGRTGATIDTGGAPTLALSYLHDPFRALVLSKGHEPRGPTEVAIDESTAATQHIAVGQRVRVAAQGPALYFEVVGLVRFGDASVGGATFVVFDLPTAQRLFLKPAQVDQIYLQAGPGVSPAQLARRVAPLLPPKVQVRTAAAQIKRNTDQVTGQLGFITAALLAFAFVAVVVGAFVIFNTFSITISQRTRELALVRTLGASRRQVLASVLSEALAIGVTGSVCGLALGFLTAEGISALFKAAGAKLPSTSPQLEPRTVIVSLAVGIGVTLLSTLAPALRATRVPPVAALREGAVLPRSRLARLGPALAVVALAAGVAMTLAGALSGAGAAVAVAGALLVLIGVTLVGPVLVRPAARIAGWPMERVTAVVGRLARENATRNPGRTASTSGALMVGIGVALFLAIFAEGARVSIRHVIQRSFTGDVAIVNRNGPDRPIPVATATAAAAVPGVEAASVLKVADSHVAGAGSGVVRAHGIDPQTIESVYRFDWKEGSDDVLGYMGPQGALVEQHLADRAHLIVGSPFVVSDRAGRRTTLYVRGIYRDRALLDGYAIGLPAFDDTFAQKRAAIVLVKLLAGADRNGVQRAISNAMRPFPEVQARSQRQLADDEAARLNSVLALFYALLAMSVIVSLFGIVNSLTLSVHERTRELGLLRAVGMSRRQVRRLVRYESVITSAIGAVLGLGIGLFFGAVVAGALSDQDFQFAVPWAQLAGLIVLTLVLGVLAAAAPARRASRLDVLAAIAHE